MLNLNRKSKIKTGNASSTSLTIKCKYFNLAVFMFVSSLLFRMYVASTASQKSEEYSHIYSQVQDLKQEITYLKYQDLELSELSYVESKARGLGLKPMDKLLVSLDIKQPAPIAYGAR